MRGRWKPIVFRLGSAMVLAWASRIAPGAAQEVVASQESRPAEPTEFAASLQALIEADWIDQDRQFASAQTVAAAAKKDTVSATQADAAGGCDGVKNGRFGFHTASNETDPWWQVDLGRAYRLDRVVIYNRTDGNTASRSRYIRVLVALDAENPCFTEVYRHNGKIFFETPDERPLIVNLKGGDIGARIVRLQVPGKCSFALDEVEVYGTDDPDQNIALRKPADQKSVGAYSRTPGSVKKSLPAVESVSAGRVFSLHHTREVLRRASALASRLRSDTTRGQLEPLEKQVDRLEVCLGDLGSQSQPAEDRRRELYLNARRLLRRIAMVNPLLDFNQLLFIKRNDPGGLFHMVHQYYGFCAKPGGGLFILKDPFSASPTLIDVLANSTVEKGRLKGRRLLPGSFLSPNLSYDAKTILFAHTECGNKGIEWSPRASYHIFRVNVDGSGLVQLTDGRWNDFDPCFLPNGRILFISERRGGYLRCGGSAPPYDSPTYTLHSMAADGSDIVCLSFHETQEWHPSVTNDGMIVYTRWDYVDRDTNVAHHIWTCYPDGRDPRSFHGNYPQRRENRPWMEMSIRPIPGSPRFVATAAAHHGHAFGSLVLIDPRLQDDGAMSQLTRLTPDVPFPEAECPVKEIKDRMIYGTPWPLSEVDFLCVYDRQAGNRGIYWIDRHGNRELIYRDPNIHCLSPMPVCSRTVPPIIPDRTLSIAADAPTSLESGESRCASTVAVMNVYDSDFKWPKGTKVTALRIIHVLPKTTPPANKPRIGVANGTNARGVLGTIPVEPDGSAYFEAPAGKPIYFQALDEQGMAVQSMRSATYLHPGEQLTCRGCHESKHRAAANPERTPLALQRSPSRIRPAVDGSNPFNYVRLVQPVLDRHCVDCHRRKKAVDLGGAIEGQYGWTRSYANLAGKYGFYYDAGRGSINNPVHGGSRTVAGKFGARAARLLGYLAERHYGVELPLEDYHRITLWLDCNSDFYGAYENTEAQARGEVVQPSLD